VLVTYHVADVRAAASRALYLGRYMLKRNCRVIHYSHCAGGMAVAEEDKATASVLVEQKERDPLGGWSVSEERLKRSTSSKGLEEAQRAGVPVVNMSAFILRS
jgi:hypothetical protein